MLHHLRLGRLDQAAIEGCEAVATRALDVVAVRRVATEYPGSAHEFKDRLVVLPWH
jgi:hypothetical protein